MASRPTSRGLARRPQATPPTPPGGSKMISAHVRLLDDTISTFHIQYKCLGQSLFDQVCQMLNLLEVDYFGLEYSDSKGTRMWVDGAKPMCRQLGLSLANPELTFCVKFYPPDPVRQLEEEYTRFLFGLQIKRDLAQGTLQCNDNTAALMASYIVQAECGDYCEEDYPDHTYLSSHKFVPHQDAELEKKIMENHKKHLGLTPSEADINLLETARRCELYGLRMNPAKDCQGASLSLAVAHLGILVFQGTQKLSTFSWAKIRKLSFKRRRFLIKLHPDSFGYFKDTVEFVFSSRNECKNFWKKCLENHAFFRCADVRARSPPRRRLFSKGSSFRYSGRTQKQMIEYVRENFIKRQHFQRSNSLRGFSSRSQPLVPIGESQSCGSISLNETSSPVKQFSLSQPSSPMRSSRADLPPAFESPPPYPISGSPGGSSSTQDRVGSGLYLSEAASTKGLSSGEEEPGVASCSPTSPLRSLRDTSSLYSSRCNSSKMSQLESSYYVVRELVSTERTYKKDLELVNVWLRDELSKEDDVPQEALSRLFLAFDPLYEFHCAFLRDLELRLSQWEGRSPPLSRGVGDLFLQRIELAEIYGQYMERMPGVLRALALALVPPGSNFERVYSEFEKLRVCHLPLSAFLLRPAHRLLHYCHLLEALVRQYEVGHPDLKGARTILLKLKQNTTNYLPVISAMENTAKLMDLQRVIIGIENIFSPNRVFFREGVLYKLSKKGFQQRIVFLFSDSLIYGAKSSGGKFRAHGLVELQDAMVEGAIEPRAGMRWCFAVHGSGRSLILAASTEGERLRWLMDLTQAKEDSITLVTPLVLLSASQNPSPRAGSVESLKPGEGEESSAVIRPTTTTYVAWHRGTSVGRVDYVLARNAYLSGFLLRKFKNTSGWQKLWVVYANFSLFFYKTHQDDFPLASLPLLGYHVSLPQRGDDHGGNLVFKLAFRSHVYFFRADSDYAFYRWLEVLKTAATRS